MKKEQNTQEQRLLSHASLDELIKIKMEEELKEEFQKAKVIPQKKVITDISEVPSGMVFSRQTVFKMFNRANKTETYLNGLQAEALLGLQNVIREKMKLGQMDAFSTEGAYVKFEKIEL